MIIVRQQQLHQMDVPLGIIGWDHDFSVTQLGVHLEPLELIRPIGPRFGLLREMEIIDLSLNGYLYLGVNHLHELSEE